MKKLFTLMSVLALAASSCFAKVEMPKIASMEWNPTPEAAQALRTHSALLKADQMPEGITKNSMKRIYKDNLGNTWTVMLAYSGFKITDVWSFKMQDGSAATFEKIPFYIAEYAVSKMSPGGSQEVFCDLLCSWPSYRMWEDRVEFLENYDIVSLTDMGTSVERGLCSTFAYFDDNDILYKLSDDGNEVLCWGIWSNAYNEQNDGSIKATQQYQTFNAVLAPPSASKMTQFIIKDFDPTDQTILTDFSLFMKYGSGDNSSSFTNVSPAITCQYDGKPRIMGFELFDYEYKFDNIHIFDLGLKDEATMPQNEDYFDFDWEPYHKFYICTGTDILDVFIKEDATTFSTDCFTYNYVEGVDPSLKTTETFNIINGPLFAPAENPEYEYPYGVYRMQSADNKRESDYIPGQQEIYVVPEPYTIIPFQVTDPNYGGYYQWSTKEAMESIWEGYYWIWRSTPGSFSGLNIGTEEGFSMYGKDSFGNTYHGTSKNKIFYHNNPKNVKEFVMIDAVGNVVSGVDKVEASKFGVRAQNGAIVVASENAADVVVYNLSGAKVAAGHVDANGTFSANVEKGMYIVKVGKAAKKVVL